MVEGKGRQGGLEKGSTVKKPKLNDRQRAFLVAYLSPKSETRYNAKQSAIAAGYSPKSAAETGCEILMNSNLRDWAEEVLAKKGIPPERVIEELSELAFAPVAQGRVGNPEIKLAALDRLTKILHVGETAGEEEPEPSPVPAVVVNFDMRQRLAEAQAKPTVPGLAPMRIHRQSCP